MQQLNPDDNGDKSAASDRLRGVFDEGTQVVSMWVTVAVLLAWYVLMLGAVIGSLSAQRFRDQVEEDGTLTVSDVFRMTENLSMLDAHIAEIQKNIDGRQKVHEELAEATAAARDGLETADGEVTEVAAEVEARIQLLESSNQSAISSTDRSLLERVLPLLGESDELASLWGRYQGGFQVIRDLKKEYFISRRKLERSSDDLETLSLQLEKLREDRIPEEPTKIRAFADDLEYMRVFNMDFMVKMPTQTLTLVLVVAMGILGSLIHITREYFEHFKKYSGQEGPGTGVVWLFFRPWLGAVTAIAIYVLAKAGLLMVGGSENASTESLSPFFIAFLAIVSGLLSEQAADRIRMAGAAVFKTEEGEKPAIAIDRYAVGFGRAVNDKQLDELRRFVNVDQETLTEWIEGQTKVPYDAQRIIAAWLNTPMEQIFTDLAPGTKAGEST